MPPLPKMEHFPMVHSVDIAVYIALNEEFSHVLALLPNPQAIVENYLSLAAASPGQSLDQWRVAPSSGAYRPNPRLLDRIQNLRHIFNPAWDEWKQDTEKLAETLLGEKRATAIENGVTRINPT